MEFVPHKKGDTREDGMVFWRYAKSGYAGECWCTPEKFAEKRESRQSWLNLYQQSGGGETVRAQKAAYYEANREFVLEQSKRYREANREQVRATKAAYYEVNRDEISKKTAIYHKANRKAISATQKERYKNDPLFALTCRMRISVCNTLRRGGYTKRSKTAEIIGCSFEDLKTHLENQFVDGMNWENRNEWHVDHIVPIASAKTEGHCYSLQWKIRSGHPS